MAAFISPCYLTLPEPSYCRIKYNAIHSLHWENLQQTEKELKSLILSKKQHGKLLSEFKLLRIVIFKRNAQLRKEKSIQLLKRIQACLKRATLFDKIFRVASDILCDLKSTSSEATDKALCYIPAQQTWTYVLYLMHCYSQLLQATVGYCVTAFEHLSCHFSSGMLIPQMLLFMGIVSRIWQLCQSLLEKMENVYNQVHPVTAFIERTPSQWTAPALPTKLNSMAALANLNMVNRIPNPTALKSHEDERNNNRPDAQSSDTLTRSSKGEQEQPARHTEEEDIGVPLTDVWESSQQQRKQSKQKKKKLDRLLPEMKSSVLEKSTGSQKSKKMKVVQVINSFTEEHSAKLEAISLTTPDGQNKTLRKKGKKDKMKQRHTQSSEKQLTGHETAHSFQCIKGHTKRLNKKKKKKKNTPSFI